MKNIKTLKHKNVLHILLAAMIITVMAAFDVYAYDLIPREYNCNRQIYIDLDDGVSEDMFWMAQVDRDCSKYNKGEWINGIAAGEKLKPKYGDERVTQIYSDNEDPTDSPSGFYEHIDCVGATPYIWIVEPEKENCKFKGWETNTSYEKITYEGYDYWIFSAGAYATDVISGSSGRCEDITIKAVWEPEVYVDYNMNGGYLTSDSSYVASDSGWMRPADGTPYTQVVYPDDWGSPAYDTDFGLKRDGYVFKGWTTVSYSDNVNDLNYRPGVGYYYGDWAADAYYNDYFGTYYVDLYAVWEPIIHVDYNMNGGYLEPDSGYIDIDGWMRPADGTSYVQSINPDDWGTPYYDKNFNLKKDGYIFKGWTTRKGSNSTADINYRPGIGYHYDNWYANAYYNDYFGTYYVDLYAIWEDAPEQAEATYTVQHFKQNIENDGYTLSETETFTAVPGSIVTPGVKNYTGFSSPDTQTITVAADNSSVIKYYYTRNSYKLTLQYDNGISSVSGDGTYKFGADVTINAILKEGYSFAGWTGSLTFQEQKNTFTMPDKDITICANSSAGIYKITYELNGGLLNKPNPSAYSPETETFTLNVPTKTGYIFKGWTGSNGNTPQVNVTIEKGSYGNKHFIANWQAATDIKYTVNHFTENLNSNNEIYDTANFSLDSTEILYGQTGTALILSDLSKDITGFTYKCGRVNDKEVTTVTILPDGSLIINLYYSRNSGIIKFIANGGNGNMPDIIIQYEEEIILPECAFNCPDCRFKGWGTKPADIIPVYSDKGSYKNMNVQNNAVILLYAIWDEKPNITAIDRYFTLFSAQSGAITEENLLSTVTAKDKEDELLENIHVKYYDSEEWKQFTSRGSSMITYEVKDSSGNISTVTVTVFIVDTAPQKIEDNKNVRFISPKYYLKPENEGGLKENSIWKTNHEYAALLKNTMDNIESMQYETKQLSLLGKTYTIQREGSISRNQLQEQWIFKPEDVKKIKSYISEHGFGKLKEPDALKNFYNEFRYCKQYDMSE